MAQGSGTLFYLDEFANESGNRQYEDHCRALLVGYDDSVIWHGIVMDENLSFSISNNYENNASGPAANFASTFNSKRGDVAQLGAYSKEIQRVLNGMDDENGLFGTIASAVGSIDETVNKFIKDFVGKDARELANLNMESVDQWLYLFKGSEVTVPTKFQMQLMTDSMKRDVYADLQAIVDKCLGDFEGAKLGNSISSLLGYQKPPYNYQLSISDIASAGDDKKLPGTFTLVLLDTKDKSGKQGHRFPGLVVTNLEVEMSTINCPIEGGKYRPLYLNLNFDLKCIIRYNKNTIKNNIIAI